MSGLQNTAHELRDEVNLLDKQHDATARMVSSLDQQLVAITDEVKTTTSDLEKSQREASMKRTVLQRRLIEIYKRGPLYSAEVLFSAQSVGQLVARYKYLHLLALRDKGLVHRLDELHAEGAGSSPPRGARDAPGPKPLPRAAGYKAHEGATGRVGEERGEAE
jgi:peptidoglycan hydrolase CwlO-like protein